MRFSLLRRFLILTVLPLALSVARAQTTLTGTLATYANGTAYVTNSATGNQSQIYQLNGSGVLSIPLLSSAPHTLFMIAPVGSGLSNFAVALPGYTDGGSTSITSLLTANVPPSPASAQSKATVAAIAGQAIAPASTNGVTAAKLATVDTTTSIQTSLNTLTTAVNTKLTTATYFVAIAPVGACTTPVWAFADDGTISYCKAGTWEVAVTAP